MLKQMTLLLAANLLLVNSAFAINSLGYVKIKEVKAWNTTIDVYLADDQEHQCTGSQKTRFLGESAKPHHVSFILTAFSSGKAVSLSYLCNNNGHPVINGIRMH